MRAAHNIFIIASALAAVNIPELFLLKIGLFNSFCLSFLLYLPIEFSDLI